MLVEKKNVEFWEPKSDVAYKQLILRSSTNLELDMSAPPQAPFKNIYHKRKVADSASRACFICCKPTPVVLVSSDGKVTPPVPLYCQTSPLTLYRPTSFTCVMDT